MRDGVVGWQVSGSTGLPPRVAAVFAALLTVSGILTVLHLAISLSTPLIYNCIVVQPERAATLASVLALIMLLHVAAMVLDVYRWRLLCRAGFAHAETLDRGVFALLEARRGTSPALLDDVERVRCFLASMGPCAVLDALWLPVFVIAVFVLHPLLGLFACVGAVLLSRCTLSIESRERASWPDIGFLRRGRRTLARELGTHRLPLSWPSRRPGTAPSWETLSRRYWVLISDAQARIIPAVAIGKGLRLVLQSAGVGLGALLVFDKRIDIATLFASSLLLVRIFACVDGVLSHRRGLMAARESHSRLQAALTAAPSAEAPISGGGECSLR